MTDLTGLLHMAIRPNAPDLPGLIDPNNFAGSNDRPYRSSSYGHPA
jgi:hypothetical protein